MVFDYLSGNYTLAVDSQLKAIPLINSLFSEVNPIPVKAALTLMGYNVGNPRLPLIPISNLNGKKLENEMKKMKII